MKVGFFTDTYFPQVNGVTYTIDAWKKRMKDEAVVYFPRGNYEPRKNEIPMPSIMSPFYRGYRVALPFGISKKAKDLDIVHIHGIFTMAWAGAFVSRRYKLPRILTYHTPVELYSKYFTRSSLFIKPFSGLYRFWERRLLKSCDLVTVSSTPVKHYLEERGISGVRLLTHGIDLSFFKKVPAKKFRERYSIKSEKVIGYCGRIGHEKRIEDLIKLAPEFDGDILILGRGPQYPEYKKMAEKFENIKFLDFIGRKELKEFYSTLDVFVFPSVVETRGIVALEAMACGTPVIGADALALKETIQDGKTGYLFEPGNTSQILDKIELAYKNRKKLSKNCIEFAKKNSADNTVRELRAIYEEFLKR